MATATEASAGRLTTHVLDTARGRPAGNLRLELFRLEDGERRRLVCVHTNEDGRCNAPLLSGPDLRRGRYEITFHVGDYLRSQGLDGAEPLFLDEVPIRFGINDEAQHYHVPLLLSPFGFTTYRGS